MKTWVRATCSSLISFVVVFGTGFDCNARAGGVDAGGGGNTTPQDNVSMAELRTTIQKYETKLPLLINVLKYSGLVAVRIENELPANFDSQYEAQIAVVRRQARIYRSLFSHKQFKIESLTGIDFREEGPCLDRSGQHKEGSVIVDPPARLCLSLSLLQRRLDRSNFELETLALYLHEIAHLLGADEGEAQAVQDDVLQMGPQFKILWGFLFDDFSELMTEFTVNWNKLLTLDVKKVSRAELCQYLGQQENYWKAWLYKMNVQSRNIAIMPLDAIGRFHAMVLLLSYSLDYCGENLLLLAFHQSKFNGKSKIAIPSLYPDPLAWFSLLPTDLNLAYSQFVLADRVRGLSVSKVQPGELRNLLFNLHKMRTLFHSTKNWFLF